MRFSRWCQLWRPVCVRCGRHGQTVLQRSAWATSDQQTGWNLPSYYQCKKHFPTLTPLLHPSHEFMKKKTQTSFSNLILVSSLDVPKEQRLQAVQAAIMLMSDENREVLQTLLCFLSDVTSSVQENQMTPMNIAVCLAPSLFHLNILKKDNLAPK